MTGFRLLSAALTLGLMSGVASAEGVALAEGVASAEGVDPRQGRAFLLQVCGQCHAVDRTDVSAHDDAPPFREIARRYPPVMLEEALGEGLVTGHEDMPEVILDPETIGDVVAWLEMLARD